MLLMAAILLTGVCVLAIFFAQQMHALNHQLAAAKEATKAESRAAIDQATALEKELVGWLVEDLPTRESIDRWQSRRGAMLPGMGWAWAEKALNARHHEQYAARLGEIRRKAMYRMAIGLVVILLLVAGPTLAVYSLYARGAAAGQTIIPVAGSGVGSAVGMDGGSALPSADTVPVPGSANP